MSLCMSEREKALNACKYLNVLRVYLGWSCSLIYRSTNAIFKRLREKDREE